LAFFALSAAFLSPVTSAHAGSWQLSCSGTGSASATAKSTNYWTAPATVPAPTSAGINQAVPDTSISLGPVGNGAVITSLTPASISASASLDAIVTGTWVGVPNSTVDPPPSSVILTENALASAVQMHNDSSGNIITTAGTVNDWLGDPVSTSGSNLGTATGTRYVSQAISVSSGTFQVEVKMSASSGDTSGPEYMDGDGDPTNGSAGCSVVLGRTASPAQPAATITVSTPVVILGGTTPYNNALYILIGQGCTSSLMGIPSALLTDPPAAAIPTYSWDVTGTTFQVWSNTTPETLQGPANPQASHYVSGPGLLSLPTASWYWNDLGPTSKPETVSCSVTLTPPTGQGSAFTVSPSQTTTVMMPDFTGTGTAGYMQVNTSAPGDSNYELWAGPTAPMISSGMTGGMSWDLSVTTPPSPAFGLGNLELVQIVTPYLTYSANGGATQTYSPGTGLDGEYPYAQGQELSGHLMNSDSPGMGLINMFFTVTQATFTPGFTDYLMYEPPNSTQFVPVGIFVWSTSGSAALPAAPNNSWSQYSTMHGGDPADAAGTVNAPNVDFVQTNSFPSWTQIVRVHN
jgi:hypothetical protein